MYRVITTNQFGLTARGWVLVRGLFSTCSFWICHPIPQFHKFDSVWRHSSLLYSSRKSKVCCNCLFVRETVLRWPLNRSKDKTRTHWNLWPSSGEWLLPGAHNPERATPILGICQGVFTDQFIFRHILGHFLPRKWNPHYVCERIRSIRPVSNVVLPPCRTQFINYKYIRIYLKVC